jgi:hypothetical protein
MVIPDSVIIKDEKVRYVWTDGISGIIKVRSKEKEEFNKEEVEEFITAHM